METAEEEGNALRRARDERGWEADDSPSHEASADGGERLVPGKHRVLQVARTGGR
jgi:hypothetical protein